MGSPKKGQRTLSASTNEKAEEMLAMRARRIDISKSEMLAKVVCWWLLNGAPPVDEDDAAQYDRIDARMAAEVGNHVAEWHEWANVSKPGEFRELPAMVAEPATPYKKSPLVVRVPQRKAGPQAHSDTA